MKGTTTWSYAPYRPFLTEVGDIYICRLAPKETSIRVEWLPCGEKSHTVLCRPRGAEAFETVGKTDECCFDITGLTLDTDYEILVMSGEKKSRIRLARCGKSVGNIVNYLHPDDEAYAFSGRFLCSPSLVRHPDGYLLASMDLYATAHPQNLTLIFRSDDEGESWHYVSELHPCFWGKMFIHKGELYMLATSTEYGDLLIGKSTDGGKTFSAPVTLLRGSNGKNGNSGVHKNPQNIYRLGGRLYNTLEWGTWKNTDYGHAAMVMSCDENDDLLDPESWHFSPPVPFYENTAPELSGLPRDTMTIEGTLVVAPDGRLLNIMRFGMWHKVLAYEVNTADPDAPLTYSRLIDFPAHFSKFMIKYDEVSGYYYSVATAAYNPDHPKTRNLLLLLRSPDLATWETVSTLLDYRHEDVTKVGFQYVDFEIEGEDLIFLCRTAMNGADTYHNSNYSTFHRIQNFRG